MNIGILERPLNKLKALRRRYLDYRKDRLFDGVEKFCLFIGYPRSGHTLVGAFIDAHPDAVVALGGELSALLEKGYSRNWIYSQLLDRSRIRSEKPKNLYRVDNQWQGGRYRRLRIIGHKRAGEAARVFASRLELLDRLRKTVAVPLKVVHTVRNPYDNIATISRKHGMHLPEAVDYYFYMCAAVRVLKARLKDDELITIRHENIIDDAKAELRRLFGFLSLDVYDEFLDDCAGLVFKKAHQSRFLVDWTKELKNLVDQRIREYSYLSEYCYDD